MVPKNGGRHCHSCNKMVIDFTAMPDTKIIAYLSQHKNVCGQFYIHQLNALNHNLAYDKRINPKWRRLMAAACVAGLLSVAKTEARPIIRTEQVSLRKKDKQKLMEDSTMVLKGKVIDKTSGLPLQNASICINSTSIGTKTDELGEFIFITPINTRYLVVFADKSGPITISLTSTNQKYLGIILPSLSQRLVINTFTTSENRFVRGEIRTAPKYRFRKEMLIKTVSMKNELPFKNWKSKT